MKWKDKSLFLIMGIPLEHTRETRIKLESEFQSKIMFFIHGSARTKPKYTPNSIAAATDTLANECTRNGLPRFITTIYFEDTSCLELRSNLFQISRLHPVAIESSTDSRINAGIASAKITEAIKSLPSPQAIPRKSKEFLPPNNFILNNKKIQDIYEEFSFDTSSREAQNALSDIKLNQFRQQDYPKDDRSLFFIPCKPQEEHGNATINTSAGSGLKYLQANYRFGVYLGSGFHHDVQYNGKALGRTQFHCSSAGKVLSNNETHANIYLNEHIRFA